MRAPKIAMLIVGLALWCGQTLAQPSQPRYSADGFYNLANSYARAGKPGLAVLNYERASLLAPDDADINANLEYVRASAGVPTEPRTRFARIAQAANPTLAAWIGVLGIALVGVGLLASKLASRLPWLLPGGRRVAGIRQTQPPPLMIPTRFREYAASVISAFGSSCSSARWWIRQPERWERPPPSNFNIIR